MIAPTIQANSLTVGYPVGRSLFGHQKSLTIVESASLSIQPGETLGLVGESGSGKTTLGRALLRLAPVMNGHVLLDGRRVDNLSGARLKKFRSEAQMIFQDPYASLNPKMTVGEIIVEPLVVHGLVRSHAERQSAIERLLKEVGLPLEAAGRYPFAFSGGQRQRIGIARALALGPKFIVADEPVSALDVSIRAQIVNLLRDLQRERRIAILFIAHDLAIVRQIADRIAIMYFGRIVEMAGRDDIFDRPMHPYTEALISAVPLPDPSVERKRLRIPSVGEPPSLSKPPNGCAYASRCPIAVPKCSELRPSLSERGGNRMLACWRR